MRKTPPLIFILCSYLLIGCNPVFNKLPSEKVLRYQENHEIIGSEKEDITGNVSDSIYETSDRTNSEAEGVEITVVNKEGIKVSPGRYEIVGFDTGNVYIRDENKDLLFHNILGSSYGVNSITVDLNDNHTIYIDGLEGLFINPVETKRSTILSAGIWEVGLDIEEGDYLLKTPSGLGYLEIFEPNEEPKLYEIIGGISGPIKGNIQLKTGQKLRVTGVSIVNFLPPNH